MFDDDCMTKGMTLHAGDEWMESLLHMCEARFEVAVEHLKRAAAPTESSPSQAQQQEQHGSNTSALIDSDEYRGVHGAFVVEKTVECFRLLDDVQGFVEWLV